MAVTGFLFLNNAFNTFQYTNVMPEGEGVA